MSAIRFLQIFTHPGLEIRPGIGPGVSGLFANSRQRSEADTESHVLDVVLGDEVITSGWEGRKFKKFEQSLAGEGPSLLVAVGEGFGVCEGFCE